ncbi:MAG: tRNA lysidine(34) synthetase TilS [Azospirillum brasilense]|nr:MAG: tRNA lysidine(34) synthetase TilS [Azospirillum brasilense]
MPAAASPAHAADPSLLFHQAMQALGPFEASPHLAIACSGGADSMALTLLANAWARARGGRITALTVDHRLRPESTAEAAQVGAWLQARGIAHAVLTPEHTEGSANLQEAARQWRYDALAHWCRAHGVLHCLVAHHAQDQAETQYLAQARGRTADGPAGMSALRLFGGVRFLRPLLHTTPAALRTLLQAQQLPWVEDPSNQNMAFARVAARKAGVPAACADAAHARMQREAQMAHAAMQCCVLHPLGYADLDAAQWQHLPEPLRTQLLADMLTTISGHIHRPRGHETQRLAEAMQQPDPRPRTLHGCSMTPQAHGWRIARELARVAAPLTLQGEGTTTWDGRFRVHYALPSGMTLQLRALGADGKRQLRAQHVAWATALPLATPSLWHLDELLHLPHMQELPASLANTRLSVGFAPPKPLAAQAFWWLTRAATKD